jgi:N-acetylglucosaminyl-diphospho-decaprenol L-rhamnosyltransferase
VTSAHDVSVVVPNRDGAGLVGRCATAALASGVGEVVVVDDGSTDGSPAEAATAGARVLRSPGRGFSAAVNHGVAASSGRFALVLNSDCFLEPDAPSLLARALDDDPLLGLCGAALDEPDGSPSRSHGHLLTLALVLRQTLGAGSPAPPPSRASGVQRVSFVPLACVLVRREAWDEIGGLDERYPFYFEDHDVCWRLQAAGWNLGVCWDAHALHVGGGSSARREPQRWFRQYHESRALYLRKRYPRLWPLYAAAWVPSALAHAAVWRVRRSPDARAWARAYAASALAGLGR